MTFRRRPSAPRAPRLPVLDWHDLTLRERARFPALESSLPAREAARFVRDAFGVRKLEFAPTPAALAFADGPLAFAPI